MKTLKMVYQLWVQPFKFYTCDYIQLDSRHVGLLTGLTWTQIIKLTSGLASPTQYTPKWMYHSWF